MALSRLSGIAANRVSEHWAFRYGLALVLYAATIGLSLTLNYFNARINLTIPVVFAVVASAWYGGRGPGLLIGVLFLATTVLYAPVPPDSSIARIAFTHFSVFSLYVFLAFVISGLRDIQHRLREQRDLLQVTLASIGDAVITTDTGGRITFMNPVAERLTGWSEPEATGRALEEVVSILDEETRQETANPAAKVLVTNTVVAPANHSILVSRSGMEVPIDDTAAPIKDGGEIKGAVLVFSDVTQRKQAERARREAAIMQGLVEAQESERLRIARDLHDHLGQRMTALRLRIESLTEKCGDNPILSQAIEEVQRSASQIDRDIAFLSWELRPTELENLGLADALRSFVREWSRQYGIEGEFHTSGIGGNGDPYRLSKTIETNLYRIVQEALNNVLKHSGARSVNVLLQRQKEQVRLIVEDDGNGFESGSGPLEASRIGGLGLLGMQERAAVMQGALEIDSGNGSGTTVVVRVPLTAPAEAGAMRDVTNTLT